MAQAVREESTVQRTARIAFILTVCVLVMAGLYVATLYLITS